MANRLYNVNTQSLEKAPVTLYAKVAFGATGAPTLSAANSKGISTITRNGAGDYTIKLQDTYYKLLVVKHVFDTTTPAAAPASPGMYIKAQAVTSLTAPTVRLVFNTAGTATDPASGEIVFLQIVVSNTSV